MRWPVLCTHHTDSWTILCLSLSLQTFVLITAATRSVNLELQPSKIQIWKASCQDPIPPELQDKVRLTLSCLGGHLQIHGDIEASPIVLGEQTFMEKTRQRFQRIATTLADLYAEGLNAQTVNDLQTMYVGTACQHVLHMSLVPEATSPPHCSFYLSNLEDLWCGLCCTMVCLAFGHSHNDGNNPVTRHRYPFSTLHHDSEPSSFNSKPHFHYK